MNSGLHERITVFLHYIGVKPSRFEIEMGFSRASFARPLKKELPITSDRLELIFSKYTWLNPNYIFNGEEPMDLRNKPQVEVSPVPDTPNALGLIEQMINNAPEDLKGDLGKLKEYIIKILDSNAKLNDKLIKSYESRDKIIKMLEDKL